MKEKNLEEVLYKGIYICRVYHENDDNGHLKCSDYFDYCEDSRYDFLKKFAWSDKYFNEELGIAMRRGDWTEPNPAHKGEIKYNERLRVYFDVTKKNRKFFGMHFNFYNEKRELIFETGTNDFFVSVSRKKDKIIDIPNFFIETLRNYSEVGMM